MLMKGCVVQRELELLDIMLIMVDLLKISSFQIFRGMTLNAIFMFLCVCLYSGGINKACPAMTQVVFYGTDYFTEILFFYFFTLLYIAQRARKFKKVQA